MAILKPDTTTTMNGVTVNEYLLTKHNPNHIAMPSASMEGKIIGVTVHNRLGLQLPQAQRLPSSIPVPLLTAT